MSNPDVLAMTTYAPPAGVTLRPVDFDQDVARIVELVNTVNLEPVSVELMQEWEHNRSEGSIVQRLAAVDESGYVLGTSHVDRAPWQNPGRFFCSVIVDPAAQGRGIGSWLYDHAHEFTVQHGATHLKTEVRDDLEPALRFAERRGFQIDRHIFDSTLDVPTFDENRFAGTVEAVQASGIRFLTFADFQAGEEEERKLYELNWQLAQDIPGWDMPKPPFEEYRKWAFTSSTYRPDGVIVAADGDRWIGFASLIYNDKTGGMINAMTGVDREYRGRKVALALKLLAIGCARNYGVSYILTNNDEQNAPMLAVNRKLGYKPQPGHYIMLKKPA